MKSNRKGLITGIIALSIIIAGTILMNQGKKGGTGITLQVIGEDYSPMWGLKEIRNQFEEETGVALEIHTFDNVTVRKKYINMFQAGGSEYDVIMTQAFDVGLMSVNDWPLDLTKAVAVPETRIEGLDMQDLAPRILDLSCRYDGKLLAMPCSANCMFLWYRKDLFSDNGERERFEEKFGYPLPQPTPEKSMTWSQFRDVAEFFTRDTGAELAGEALANPVYGTLIQGKNQVGLWFEFLNYLYSFGGSVFDADQEQVTINSEAAKNALNYYIGLKDFSPPGTANYSFDEALQAFQNGEIAMMIMWNDTISAIENLGGSTDSRVNDRVGYSVNPTLTERSDPATSYGGWSFVVNKNSKNRGDAVKFVQWVNRPDVQLEWAKVGGLPAAQSVYKSEEYRSLPGADANLASLPFLVGSPTAPYAAQAIEVVQNEVANAVAGNLTVDEALSNMEEKLRAVVEGR